MILDLPISGNWDCMYGCHTWVENKKVRGSFSVSFGLEIGSEIEIRNRSVADVDPEGEDLDRCLVEVANFARQEVLEFRESLFNFENTAVDHSSDL